MNAGTQGAQAALPVIGQQLDALKQAGANVVLAGVDQGKFSQYNTALAAIAEDKGVPFAGPLPTNDVHPSPAGYKTYVENAAKLISAPSPSTAGQPQASQSAPVDAEYPRFDQRISDIEAAFGRGDVREGAARAGIAEVERQKHDYVAATQGERVAIGESVKGGMALLANGRPYQWDEPRIRHLYPPDKADEIVQGLHDAADQGWWHNYFAGATPDQIGAALTHLHAQFATDTNPLNAARRLRGIEHAETEGERALAGSDSDITRQAAAGLPAAPVPSEAAQPGLPIEDLRQLAQASPQYADLQRRLGPILSETDAQRQQRLLTNFSNALVAHYKGLTDDPASYVAANTPRLQTLAQHAAAQFPDTAEGKQQAATAFGQYASAADGMQEYLGLEAAQRHVLGAPQARTIVQQLTSDPENAPARMKAMGDRFGDWWPRVWQDLSTTGKLPGAWQLVGQLADYDPENAGLLARQLAQEPKGGRAGAGGPVLRERSAAGASSIEQQLDQAIDGDPRVQQFNRSLANGFVSEAARNDIVSAIGSLARARFLFRGEDPTTAATTAVNAAIGHYEFDPRSNARAPSEIFDRVSDAARRTLGGLSPATVAVPPGFGNGPQAPTPDDYVAALRSAGMWINAPRNDAWWLIDQAGRFVMDRNSHHVAVPFAAAQGTPTPAPVMPSATAVAVAPF